MIRTMLHDRSTGQTRTGDEGLLIEWADNPNTWIWADFEGETPAREAELFSNHFNLDPLVIADAQRDRHPPKLEAFDDYFFLLLKGLDTAAKDIEFRTIQIALFVGERFLVTRCKVRSASMDGAWEDVEKGALEMDRGPAHIAYRIIRQLTDQYTNIVEGLERRLDELEDEMFENPRDAILEELVSYNGNLKKLRRIFTYHQDLFARLSQQDSSFVGKRERHEFNDAYEHTERLVSLSGLFSELADDLMNGYISLNSHHLNQIMKVLTIVTVIFAPMALLVGMYGMNFEYIPELKVKHGYFIFLGVMGLIVASLLLLFRKLKWL